MMQLENKRIFKKSIFRQKCIAQQSVSALNTVPTRLINSLFV